MHVVILRVSHVTALDTIGALVLEDAISKLEHQGIAVLMSACAPTTAWARSAPCRSAVTAASSNTRPTRSPMPAPTCPIP